MYRVRLAKQAAKFYKSADPALAKRMARAFEMLETDPRNHPNIKPLKGELAGRYRYRVGDYRIVYRIVETDIEVLVLLIKHRRDVYE
jgi:mRNA interferase RelE/StbE